MSVKIPPYQEGISKLGTWVNATAITNPSTQTITLATPNPQSITSVQTTLQRLQPGIITKVLIQCNGGTEWTSGTMRFRLWKNNAARVGAADFDTGNLSLADMPDDTISQRLRWFDANVLISSETDYFTASLDTIAQAGGPEGHEMQLWGITGAQVTPSPNISADPEVGTNSNGTFEKYSDGRLICYAMDAATRTTSLAIGNVYRSSPWVATFPHAFIAVPVVIWGADYVGSTSLLGAGQAGPTTTTQSTARVNGSVNSSVGRLQYVAYGRWK